MRPFFTLLFLLISTSCLFALEGCSLSRQPPPTRLYVLTTLPQSDRAPHTALTGSATVGVGPVELPRYTDRPQMVIGNTGPELSRAPFDNWAEPLEGNFARVLAENLSLLLATDQVAVFPWKGPISIEYQVVVEVTKFLGEPGGQASLEARWSVLGKNGQEVLVRKKSSFTEPIGGEDYQALAAAMSRMVAGLSRDIAASITTLASTPSRR
jgi:uncharacterized lipoprotein YmbA